MLLDAPDTSKTLGSQGLKRLGLFTIALIGLYVLCTILVLAMVSGILLLFSRYVPAGEGPQAPDMPFQWFVNVSLVIAMWVIGRFSLMLPAIAVDRTANPFVAWRLSRGNNWKLLIIVGVLPYTLKWIVALLSRDGGTMWEYGVLLVLTAVFTVIQVVALSLSYWELTQPEPPPTPPPA